MNDIHEEYIPSWPREIMKCENCGKPLYKDQTNNGVVTRCRNPECPINVVTEE